MAACKGADQPLRKFYFQVLKGLCQVLLGPISCGPISLRSCFLLFFLAVFYFFSFNLYIPCICTLSSGTFYTYSVLLHHSSVPDLFSYSLVFFPMQWCDGMWGEVCPKSLEQAVELGEGVGFIP